MVGHRNEKKYTYISIWCCFCRMTIKSPAPIPSPIDKFENYKQMMYAIRSHISLCICLEMIFKLPQKYINSSSVGHPLHESQFRTVNDGYFQSKQLHRYIPFVVHILYGKGGALITSAQQNSVWGILKTVVFINIDPRAPSKLSLAVENEISCIYGQVLTPAIAGRRVAVL